MANEPARDPEAVSRLVERFGSVLTGSGVPRMPARVFVTLPASDAGRLTAAELAERVPASPAAISGAVRYLVQVHLAVREREPGTRRDVFRLLDDSWYEALLRREQTLRPVGGEPARRRRGARNRRRRRRAPGRDPAAHGSCAAHDPQYEPCAAHGSFAVGSTSATSRKVGVVIVSA